MAGTYSTYGDTWNYSYQMWEESVYHFRGVSAHTKLAAVSDGAKMINVWHCDTTSSGSSGTQSASAEAGFTNRKWTDSGTDYDTNEKAMVCWMQH